MRDSAAPLRDSAAPCVTLRGSAAPCGTLRAMRDSAAPLRGYVDLYIFYACLSVYINLLKKIYSHSKKTHKK